MELHDPATGRALPADAIQRILFIANKLHVYNIPPLASMRGHNASTWTTDASRHIFTARLRVIETSHDSASPSSSASASSSQPQLKVDVVLEDPASGQLFAASPYTDRTAVEPAVDSSRFFALTVRDDAGRKAVLGIGFEERPEAFDFAVALQEARKSLGWDGQPGVPGGAVAAGGKNGEDANAQEQPRDYSLKEGETIMVNLGSKFGRRRPQQEQEQESSSGSLQSFALAPPPPPPSSSSASPSPKPDAAGDGGFALAPPPSASDVKKKRRSLMDMGFDDGQFGEFA